MIDDEKKSEIDEGLTLDTSGEEKSIDIPDENDASDEKKSEADEGLALDEHAEEKITDDSDDSGVLDKDVYNSSDDVIGDEHFEEEVESTIEGSDTSASVQEDFSSDYNTEDTNQDIYGGSEDVVPEDNNTVDGTVKEDVHSSVSTTSRSKNLMLFIVLVIIGVLIYVTLIDVEPPTAKEKEQEKEAALEQKKEDLFDKSIPVPIQEEIDIESAPSALDPPEIEAPAPPTPEPAPVPKTPPSPVLDVSDNIDPAMVIPPSFEALHQEKVEVADILGIKSRRQEELDAEKKRLKERRGAGIMVFGGGGGIIDKEKQSDSSTETPKKNTKTEFLGFSEGILDEDNIEHTSSEQVRATKIGKLDNMIAQGKIIYAVLETAISTDLQGIVRAIIARDVYAERNRNVLIPKGSRIIGQYSSDIANGQTRVGITWTRLIRPDGIDIQIGSWATDQLGRSGIVGELDNKFWQRMTSAFLISYVIPKSFAKIFKVNKGEEESTTITNKDDGETEVTRTESEAARLRRQSTEKFKDITEDIVKKTFSEKPSIHVAQGARINILVQKDLIFPSTTVLKRLKTKTKEVK